MGDPGLSVLFYIFLRLGRSRLIYQLGLQGQPEVKLHWPCSPHNLDRLIQVLMGGTRARQTGP